MPRLPLWAGSVSGAAWRLLPAGADGYGREHCPGGLQEHEAGQTETAGVEGPGPGLSDLGVFQTLIEHSATVVVIEHDLDVIRNADFIIDMGPGGGELGGLVVAAGTPEEVPASPNCVTGQYLR